MTLYGAAGVRDHGRVDEPQGQLGVLATHDLSRSQLFGE